MNPWPFVIAAYGVTVLSVTVLALVSWRAMRRAEAAAEDLRKRR